MSLHLLALLQSKPFWTNFCFKQSISKKHRSFKLASSLYNTIQKAQNNIQAWVIVFCCASQLLQRRKTR